MDETTFRILDTLSRDLGSMISIHQLTSKIKQYHGTAYYARTYNKLKDLSTQGLINITKAGRSSIPSLNFASYGLPDLLSEIEMRKKRELLDRSKALQPLLMDMEAYARSNSQIESISLINPERNARLNRAEFLILMRNFGESRSDETKSVYKMMRDAQSRCNVRADGLLLSSEDFANMLASDEINPLREMLSNKITFYAPQAFWAEIAVILARGYRIRLRSTETNPAKIAENDLIFNLNRFGYRELGPRISEGEKICIEYIIVSLMMKGDARRINAIPAIVSKNKVNRNLLVFLFQKHGLSGRLLGLLRAMHKIAPEEKTAIAMSILEELSPKEIRADEEAVARNMRLYNATG
ncbi:MAG: hypothetical protein V1857_04365 [archaeon]